MRAGGRVEECHESGTLLGISDEPDLASAETVLAPGDALVLYTDRLDELAASFSARRRDDLALLVARVTS